MRRPYARWALPLNTLLAMSSGGCELGGSQAPEANAVGAFDLGGCTLEAVVEDSEDNDHRILERSGRGGYVYAFLDEAGSTVEPVAGRLGGTFSQAEGGANGSMYAARVHGTLANGSITFAGYGLNFVDPKGPYDASAYDGVAFFARRGPDSASTIRLKVPDASTDPDGGICTECFNDFGADVELEEEWQQYVFPFDRLGQLAGWGSPRPGSIDASAIYGLQFQVNSPGASFDIWVDDVSFYGCKQ
ncbi:hypothetical protein [Paraliomyxa miuraensis]|uniref:hypothetical protein n=1 Tax=Paraliomyxa miuraensis TaxID=376150 RepID=UPI0022574CFB|nr:hypothetical protein [Paraliomyxa miuraensis]MCX4244857.1 hypothetical protein [Paraliomyxa miuraensis]